MKDVTINIFIGVISGILTSLFIYIIYKLKYHIFDPWLENSLYKGVLLEGTWSGKRIKEFATKKGDNKIHQELDIHLELKQSGYKVSGIFSAESKVKEGKESNAGKLLDKYINLYTVKGHVHDNYLVLEYCPISRKRTGLGAFVMQVKNGGKRMEGSISFVEETDMEVMTMDGAILNRADYDNQE